MRQNFKVLRAGVATDGTFFAGKPIEFTFDPEKADLVVGEIFSAEVTEVKLTCALSTKRSEASSNLRRLFGGSDQAKQMVGGRAVGGLKERLGRD